MVGIKRSRRFRGLLKVFIIKGLERCGKLPQRRKDFAIKIKEIILISDLLVCNGVGSPNVPVVSVVPNRDDGRLFFFHVYQASAPNRVCGEMISNIPN